MTSSRVWPILGITAADQLDGCEQKEFEVTVAEPKLASHKGRDGRFGRDDVKYYAEADVCFCPADEKQRRGGKAAIKSSSM